MGYTMLILVLTCTVAVGAALEIEGPVFITEPPSSVVFLNTDGVTIPCSAYGRPAPVMDWVRDDGTSVVDIPGLIEVLSNNSLHIKSFPSDKFRVSLHAAFYRCVASNTAGVIVSRKIHVSGVLLSRYRTYNVRVNDIYVTRGNTAVFKCFVDPYYVRDHVHVTAWTQNDQPVTLDENVSVLSSGELLLHNVQTESSYMLYRCVTVNDLSGEEKTSDPATLYVLDPVNSPPSLQDLPKTITVRQGGLAELPCVASAHPEPEYSWSHDDVLIAHDQSRVREKGGNLLIETAVVRDSGIYACTAVNSLGSKSIQVNLVVTAPLSAYLDPDVQTVDVGHPVTFNCTVYGHPVLGVQWFKDGLPLISNKRVFTLSAHSLRILQVEREDGGMYQCLAWNVDENTQAASQLIIGAARPHVYESSGNQTVAEGQSISLKCVASGNPRPTFQWLLDDGPLKLDVQSMITSNVNATGDVISTINIKHIKLQDGGQYKCIASNSVGSSEKTTQVNIYGTPFIRELSNITAVAHNKLSIKCYVLGYPVNAITWWKGANILPANHRQHVSVDGLLTIQNVSREQDDGEYKCEARNADGQGMERSLYITVFEPPDIDPFQFPSRKRGERVSVTCVVSRGDLPLSIEWLWDGQPINPDDGIVVQRLGAYSSLLSISHAKPRLNGNYTCVAHNQAASANHTASLHVHLPPSWLTEPNDAFVILGNNIKLDCSAAGDPIPDVIWKRSSGSAPNSYNAIVKLFESGEQHMQMFPNGTLLIQNASVTDEGQYLCQANNGIGPGLGKVITLTVHVPVKLVVEQVNYTAYLADSVTLRCAAVGDKPLSLSWSFNGHSIDWQQNDRMRVSYDNTATTRVSSLTLNPTTRHDSGFYVCNGKNIFGSDAASFYLVILECPDPPKSLTVERGSSRDVTLNWQITFDGNSRIIDYAVESQQSSGIWTTIRTFNVTESVSIEKCTLLGLHPDTAYVFRVMASNEIGKSEPSEPVSFQTQAEAPSGPPGLVHAIAVGSQTLVIMWQPPPEDVQNGQVLGYYVGFKLYNSSAPYMYVSRSVDKLDTTNDTLTGEDGQSIIRKSSGPPKYLLTLTDLEKFTQYTIHVQAYNEQGSGPRSEDVTVFTLEDVPSQAPEGVQARALSSQSVMVVWSPPPLYTLNGILKGYKVFYKTVRDDEDESDSAHITTSKLDTTIYGLEKYTNYSIQVLAYTREGEGVRSPPVYIRTQQDLPESPADVKAIAAGPDRILVSWRPPVHANGQLIKYTVYMRDLTDHTAELSSITLSANNLTHLVTNLSLNHQYGFRVGASTVRGDGQLTFEGTASTMNTVVARIASFAGTIYSHWHTDVLLPCTAVGQPPPTILWRKQNVPVVYDERVTLLYNGSLSVLQVDTLDAMSYTCRAENIHGADEITVNLRIKAPPMQPTISIVATTRSSVQINWQSGSNGGSKIEGFIMSYKPDHEDWKSLKLAPTRRSFTVYDLSCGTRYSFKLQAYNKVGVGTASDLLTTSTNGSLPIMPAQSLILEHINMTWISLDLSTWQTGGCPILAYHISYQYWGDSVWHLVRAHINPDKTHYRVDLRPGTWYIVKVTAYNEAGYTDSLLKFCTKTFEGHTIEPVRRVYHSEAPFYQRPIIIIPLCGATVALIVLCVGLALYCFKRKLDYRQKETATNLRKDLTTESFLMSDVDKPCNIHADHSPHLPPNNTLTDKNNSSNDSDKLSQASLTSDTGESMQVYTLLKPLNTNSSHLQHLDDPDLDKLVLSTSATLLNISPVNIDDGIRQLSVKDPQEISHSLHLARYSPDGSASSSDWNESLKHSIARDILSGSLEHTDVYVSEHDECLADSAPGGECTTLMPSVYGGRDGHDDVDDRLAVLAPLHGTHGF